MCCASGNLLVTKKKDERNKLKAKLVMEIRITGCQSVKFNEFFIL